MKKFSFRLEPVLRLRKLQEDQKKRAVGSLQGQIALRQRETLTLAAEMRREGQDLKQQFARGHVDVAMIAFYQSYVSSLQRSINEKITSVGEIQQKLAMARGELTIAARDRRIIEKLKEKQRERYASDLAYQEKLQQDEAGNNLYFRNVRMHKQRQQ